MDNSFSCYSCVHCIDTKSNKPGYPTHNYCEVTKRWGKLQRGHYCNNFEYMQRPNAVGTDGIPIKNKQPLDYRTANQWQEVNRQIKDNAIGVLMHSNSHSLKVYRYYLIDETEPLKGTNTYPK